MARTQTRTDEVVCYRLLVECLIDNRWKPVLAYGPYFKAGQARATIDGAENRHKDRYLKGTRRCRVQKQEVEWAGEGFPAEIVWVDVA